MILITRVFHPFARAAYNIANNGTHIEQEKVKQRLFYRDGLC